MIQQKEAVEQAALKVIGDLNGASLKSVASKSQMKEIIEEVAAALESGTVKLSEKAVETHGKSFKKYASLLVSNWATKSKLLNGNVDFQTAKPGSRGQKGDTQVKALKDLIEVLKASGETSAILDAESALQKRLNELAASKSA